MSIPTLLNIPKKQLLNIGLKNAHHIHFQLSPDELIQQCVQRGEGTLSNTGALIIETGEFTGRSPKDKFIVKDDITSTSVHWNEFNIPMEQVKFDRLYNKLMSYLEDKEIWVRDCFACAHPKYRIGIRIINEFPACNLFAYNMFLRPDEEELEDFTAQWHIIQAPGFFADPISDGTRQHNFAAIDFKKKLILIGGTGYTGEMKKAIFTILNYILPNNDDVLSMHCSANVGEDDDTAIFFGLSGTGKTTLSADPKRKLIGDDEHGWTEDKIFNFEGGCYAKTIDLSAEKEPEIFQAIRHGALVENVSFIEGTNEVDFGSKKITENTRVSYPLNFISNAIEPSIGNIPKNIFFLTADAYGILPPISKLTPGQAMYQFISGYTARVAGTETGVTEPKPAFSACFGAPFLPLHPGRYAEMLGKKIKENKVTVWMINTGWSGGPYGIGSRIKLNYTRLMISAVLEGRMINSEFVQHPVFGMAMPTKCNGVPAVILNPRNTWADKNAYDIKALELAEKFRTNFQKYASGVTEEILNSGPLIPVA